MAGVSTARARKLLARAPRVAATLAVRRRGCQDEVLVVQDLSATGLFVGCDEPFTVGTALDLRLDLPWGEQLDLGGRVVRVGPGASGHSGMGIMFVGLDPRSGAALQRYVAERLSELRAG